MLKQLSSRYRNTLLLCVRIFRRILKYPTIRKADWGGVSFPRGLSHNFSAPLPKTLGIVRVHVHLV